jgi:RNA polymerase sigma factor (sigma-70 family)
VSDAEKTSRYFPGLCSKMTKSQRCKLVVSSSLDAWLRAAGSIPLLTPAEELYLSHLVKNGQRSNATLSQKRAAKRAIERMIKGNLRLVVKVAKSFHFRIQRSSLLLEDVLQEGCIGLHRAALKFDPEAGCKFSTYAFWWIRQRIGGAIQDNSGSVRLPRGLAHRLNNVSDSPEASKLNEYRPLRRSLLSLDAPLSESEDCRLMDVIADPNVADVYEKIDLNNAVNILRGSDVDLKSLYDLVISRQSVMSLAKQYGISRQAMSGRIKRDCKRLSELAAEHRNLVVC